MLKPQQSSRSPFHRQRAADDPRLARFFGKGMTAPQPQPAPTPSKGGQYVIVLQAGDDDAQAEDTLQRLAVIAAAWGLEVVQIALLTQDAGEDQSDLRLKGQEAQRCASPLSHNGAEQRPSSSPVDSDSLPAASGAGGGAI